MSKQFEAFAPDAPDILAVHWGWPIALGLVIAVLGVVAIWKANTATMIYVRFLGAVTFLSAFMVLVFSFALAGFWSEFFVHVLWAVLLGVVGLIMLLKPAVGAEAITLMVAMYFLVSGVFTIGFGLTVHIDNLWVYLSEGLINAGLGLLLLVGWPVSGMWAIGTFIGVDMFLKGGAIVAMALSLRAISEG